MMLIRRIGYALLMCVAGIVIIGSFPCLGGKIATENIEEAIGNQAQKHIPGEYIVTLKTALTEAELTALFALYKVEKVQKIGKNIYLVKIADNPEFEEIREKVLDHKAVKDIQPNYVHSINPPAKRKIKEDP